MKKAEAIADVVKSGLTAHMINNTMEQRQTFLNSIANTSGIDKIRVVRGDDVIKQYGETKFKQDNFHDNMDREVVQSGEMYYKIIENLSQAKLRITIPYKAIGDSTINCLECHNVKYGDTLGAVSLELNISDFKDQGVVNTMIVLAITIFGIIILLFLINKIIRPYIKTLELLKTKIEHASNGEFKEISATSVGIKTNAQEIIDLIDTYNKLTISLMKTFTEIDDKLKGFVGKIANNTCSTNPLMDAADIVTNLSYIYQFKKEVQSDRDTKEIYARLGSVFKNQFGVKYLNIIEVHNNIKVVKVYEHGGKDFCFESIIDDCNNCRALRTGECTSGIDFQTTCNSFTNQEFNYLCIEMEAGRGTNLIFNFLFETLDELKDFQTAKPFIENYIKEALPEIEMKILLKALEDASLRDGLTGLYNRRFFDEHMKKLIPQVKRNGQQLAFMMLDIDHFKAVNDEYGHDIGDKVLVESAHIIANNVRESDLVIRFGGEEFIVILVDIASEEDAYNVAMKLKEKIAENEIDVYAGSTIKKTTSVGFSMFPKDSFSLTTVMKYADLALYSAKESGRNQVKRYTKNDKEDEVELF